MTHVTVHIDLADLATAVYHCFHKHDSTTSYALVDVESPDNFYVCGNPAALRAAAARFLRLADEAEIREEVT